MTLLFFGLFAFSLALSFIATREVRDLAVRHGLVSSPGERHVHQLPLPRLGGAAIFLAFSVTLGLWLVLSFVFPRLAIGSDPLALLRISIPACLIFLLGIYDDLRGASPYLKFGVQVVAASMLFAGGMRVLNLPILFGNHTLPWFVDWPATVLWVVAVTNAFNLIDGLDGLAAGSGLFSTVVFFVVALVCHSWLGALMSLTLAGAILGFLRFNFNPATIFLGDSGSLFIGFVLSALSLAGAQKAPTFVAVAIPVVSFGLPILETSLSIVRRLISGRPIFAADREHIHHKLLQMGLSHRQVVIVLYLVSAMFAMLSLFLLWPTGSTLGLVLAVIGTVVWIGIQHLNYPEFGELRRVAQRTIEQRQILLSNLPLRRAIAEIRVASDLAQIRQTLTAALNGGEFDGFELHIAAQLGEHICGFNDGRPFLWSRMPHMAAISTAPTWKLSLDLITSANQRRGSLVLYRHYDRPDLQLDFNLLTSEFPKVLAEAIERASVAVLQPVSAPSEVQPFAASL